MADGVSVREVMSREFLGITEGDQIRDVMAVFVDEPVDGALVLRGSELVGAVTSTELLAAVTEGTMDAQVDAVMRPPPDPVTGDMDVRTVLSELSTQPFVPIPVVDQAQDLVGVITKTDAITAATSLLSAPPEETVEQPPQADLQQSQPQSGEPAATSRNEARLPNQGVCESCGTMSSELMEVNGQMQCPNCRSVQ